MILMFARYEISLIVSLVYYNVIGVKSKLIFFFFQCVLVNALITV
jgi:hypothetical protein